MLRTYLVICISFSCVQLISRLSGGYAINYDRKKKIQAGNFYYDRKKKVPVVCLAGLFCDYDWKKKVPVVCLAGCAVVVLAITTGKNSSSRLSGGLSVFGSGDYDRKKKVPVVCLAGWFCRLRPEKKNSSRLSGGLCCCGSGDYDRKK